MNEVFEKIIEKLEDKRKTAEQLIMENPQDELDRIQTQTAEDFVSAYHNAIEIVKREAEQFGRDTNVGTNGWIPVSERLPEESLNSVIGWDEYRERCCFVQYIGGRWILGNDIDSVKIIAWQPLPEPYQPKGE